MLEFPESNTYAKQLTETINGKIISYAEANKSPHKLTWYSGNPEDYNGLLIGKQIGRSLSRGGMVEIQVEEDRILLSDGSYPHYYESSCKAPKKHQLYLEFTDGSAITVSTQMYGGILIFKEGQNDNPYYLTALEKPSPLSQEFTYEYFCSLNTDSLAGKSVKAFLATEQRIPGVGNGVIQDILYQAGFHPKRKMSTLSEADFKQLYVALKKVLHEMTELHGRNTEKDLFGNPGGYVTYLSKKTYATPCPKCGYEIRKENYMGGTIYYCEHCQN